MNSIARVVLLLSLTCTAVWAQTSQVNGTIKDSSGSAIAGASIKATQTATGVIRTANSGGDGGYTLPNLPIGPYMIEVTKEGFSKHVQTGIVLQVDTQPNVDIGLQVGAVNE